MPPPENVPRDEVTMPLGMPVEPETKVSAAPEPVTDFTYVVPAVPKPPDNVGAHTVHAPPMQTWPAPQLVPSVLRVQASFSLRIAIPHEAPAQERSVHVRERVAL
jgi:hypothetical protein